MKVDCWLDGEETTIRNGNKLKVSSSNYAPNCVEVAIISKDGATMLEESVVNGMELIKAIQNAMNS